MSCLAAWSKGRWRLPGTGFPPPFSFPGAELEDLADARRRSEAVAAFEAWFEKAKQHLTPAAAELTDEDINRLVHELR